MRYTRALRTLFALLFLSGCQSGAGPLPLGTFINRSDRSQVLQLTLDPSQTSNVLLRVSIETGANKYFGKSVGTYILKTDRATATGKFLWAKSPRDGSLHEVWFTADDGRTWELNVLTDGSLSDSAGVVWQRQ
jgi:hypothetical protein